MARDNVLRIDFDRDVGAEAERGYTLPARYYLDPEVYEREKQAIFYKNWHYAAHASQLRDAGDYVTLRLADESLCVVRGGDGRLRGFFNVCKHRAHELLSGTGNTRAIVCPYHAWVYALDGRLENARKTEALPGFDKSGICLSEFRVEEAAGLVFVSLDPEAEPLESAAGDLLADLRGRIPNLEDFRVVETFCFGESAGIKANWKVVVDNFLECYHCTPAHPAFADMIDLPSYQVDTARLWSRQLGPETSPHNRAYDFDAGGAFPGAAFWYFWPTSTINLFPGSGHLAMLSILPVDLETTVFAGQRLALGDEGAENQAAFDYLGAVLGPEDQALCESVQRGLKSRSYNQGRFVVHPAESGISEHAVHHFHRLVLDALGEG